MTRHGQHGFGRQYTPRRSTRLAASSDSDWRALSTNAHGPSHHPADRLLPSISAHYSVATRRTRFNPFAAHVPPDFADSQYIIFNRPVSSSRIGAKYWDQRVKKGKGSPYSITERMVPELRASHQTVHIIFISRCIVDHCFS